MCTCTNYQYLKCCCTTKAPIESDCSKTENTVTGYNTTSTVTQSTVSWSEKGNASTTTTSTRFTNNATMSTIECKKRKLNTYLDMNDNILQ